MGDYNFEEEEEKKTNSPLCRLVLFFVISFLFVFCVVTLVDSRPKKQNKSKAAVAGLFRLFFLPVPTTTPTATASFYWSFPFGAAKQKEEEKKFSMLVPFCLLF